MIFADNLGVPEGPVALADRRRPVVEMAPERGCVTLLDSEGRIERVIARTGRPNGLAVGEDGTIWVAESRDPSPIRLSMDGQDEVVLTGCDGESFLFPNDPCFGPDGALYMTDSGLPFEDWEQEGEICKDFMQRVGLTRDFLREDGKMGWGDIGLKALDNAKGILDVAAGRVPKNVVNRDVLDNALLREKLSGYGEREGPEAG